MSYYLQIVGNFFILFNYGLAAARASEVKFSPIQNALLVEDVQFVAGQLGDIFLHLETR